jgi:hypothetical protein
MAAEKRRMPNETEKQRWDRNFGDLLQELRVAQTGVQILFAFLLSIAFQQRFPTLGTALRVLYLVTLISAATAAVLLIAPAAAHRVLFRRHRKDDVVELTSRLAAAGLTCLGVAILCAVGLIIGFVEGAGVAVPVVAVLGAVVLATWWLVPLVIRRRPDR